MQENSDQFASPEEESAFHEEIIGTDAQGQQEEESQTEEAAESEEEAEQVKPKKKEGYVEFTTPEQKARVAQLTREKHENARKAEALARELEKYKKEPEPPKEVPTPSADPVTDPDTYAQQIKAREQYIRDHAKYETEAQQRKQQIEAAEQQRRTELAQVYDKNIDRLKINRDTLKKASDICLQYGINDDLVDHLLEDPDGPAIVAHLGANVEDLAELVSLKPTKAAAFIEREIRAKLHAKKQSKAPPPPTKVSGTRQSSNATPDGWEIS